jgi:toxin ParE1/3/4
MANARRVVWAPRARRDLRDIWKYFARVGSPEIADGLLREIGRAGQRLERHPLMGRPRNELATDLRSVLVHPHLIFYRVGDETVEIARVLHERRDLGAIFARERSS